MDGGPSGIAPFIVKNLDLLQRRNFAMAVPSAERACRPLFDLIRTGTLYAATKLMDLGKPSLAPMGSLHNICSVVRRVGMGERQ